MATWKITSNQMPQGRQNFCAWAYKGRLYIAGGKTGSFSATGLADRNIWSARYGTDGDIKPFEIVGSLPTTLVDAGTYLDPNTGQVYLDCGYAGLSDTTPKTTVQVVKLEADGKPTMSTPQTTSRTYGAAFTWMSRIGNSLYQTGFNSPQSAGCRNVYRASISDAGQIGAWSRQPDSYGDMSEGAMASCRGVLVLLHSGMVAPGNVGLIGNPIEIDYAIPGSDGNVSKWNVLTKTFTPIGSPGVVGVNTGVMVCGGYYTVDGASYTELKSVYLIPVGADRSVKQPVMLASMNVGRDTPTAVTDGRFVWVLGGEDVNGVFLPTVEVFDTKDLF